jgi:hypothetical protein
MIPPFVFAGAENPSVWKLYPLWKARQKKQE